MKALHVDLEEMAGAELGLAIPQRNRMALNKLSLWRTLHADFAILIYF